MLHFHSDESVASQMFSVVMSVSDLRRFASASSETLLKTGDSLSNSSGVSDTGGIRLKF
jgi:hypothetical protein